MRENDGGGDLIHIYIYLINIYCKCHNVSFLYNYYTLIKNTIHENQIKHLTFQWMIFLFLCISSKFYWMWTLLIFSFGRYCGLL
jgi:hypothetical protein